MWAESCLTDQAATAYQHQPPGRLPSTLVATFVGKMRSRRVVAASKGESNRAVRWGAGLSGGVGVVDASRQELGSGLGVEGRVEQRLLPEAHVEEVADGAHPVVVDDPVAG